MKLCTQIVASILFALLFASCATGPVSVTTATAIPSETLQPTQVITETPTQTPTFTPTATEAIDQATGYRIIEQNGSKLYEIPGVGNVESRTDSNNPIYILDKNLQGVLQYPNMSPMYIFAKPGVLSQLGNFIHPLAYNSEYSLSSHTVTDGFPTGYADALTALINNTDIRHLDFSLETGVLDKINAGDGSLSYTLHIPTNAKDAKSKIQDYICRPDKGTVVILESFADADPAKDPAMYSMNYNDQKDVVRFKASCDDQGRTVIVGSINENGTAQDKAIRLRMLFLATQLDLLYKHLLPINNGLFNTFSHDALFFAGVEPAAHLANDGFVQPVNTPIAP